MSAFYEKRVDGKTVERRELHFGDQLERIISKIPGVKMLPCYDKGGKLKPESGCAKRKKKLNDLGKAIGL